MTLECKLRNGHLRLNDFDVMQTDYDRYLVIIKFLAVLQYIQD